MTPYRHRVQYYETDMMGITHHANYLRFMEEARIDFMAQIGFPYKSMESMGVYSPVKAVSVDYKRPCTFGDDIDIAVSVESFNGVVAVMAYEMRRDDTVICTARSEHCFLNKDGHFVRLKRDLPAFYEKLTSLAGASD